MATQFVKTTVEYEGTYTEVLVQVPERPLEHWGPDKEMSVVGKPIPRVDGFEKVTGRAKYTYDMQLPRMVYGRILSSPVPHARIKSIDTSKAEALPGVHVILTHQNFPEMGWWGNRRNKLGLVLDPVVRFVGDEVAFVVADDDYIADDALALIVVEYEELPFVPTLDAALKDDAPMIHPEGKMRNGRPSTYNRGDVEQGFKDADVILE